MRILFIRHAEAVEAEAFQGKDLDRPLSPGGRRKMRAAARVLFRRYGRPDRILTSQAVRARATALILAKAAGARQVVETPHLNPGAGRAGFRRLWGELDPSHEIVVMVGHEPDLSRLVSWLVADGALRLKFSKGACADIEMTGGASGVLRAFFQPDRLGS